MKVANMTAIATIQGLTCLCSMTQRASLMLIGRTPSA
jgi:hypothetical protein